MQETSGVAARATKDIEAWLRRRKDFIALDNVENDSDYQLRDIDLVLTRDVDGADETVTIEIKGDRYYGTGNYFFETVSNTTRNTPGCFMYTEADYLFYYFVDARELHIMKLDEVRPWFLERIDTFKERGTSTSVGNGASYSTLGKLVPRNMVPGVKVVKI